MKSEYAEISRKTLNKYEKVDTLLDSATLFASAVQSSTMQKHDKLDTLLDSATLLASALQNNINTQETEIKINPILCSIVSC